MSKDRELRAVAGAIAEQVYTDGKTQKTGGGSAGKRKGGMMFSLDMFDRAVQKLNENAVYEPYWFILYGIQWKEFDEKMYKHFNMEDGKQYMVTYSSPKTCKEIKRLPTGEPNDR